jgi:hypothetical protein
MTKYSDIHFVVPFLNVRNDAIFATLEVLTAILLKIQVVWYVT